MGISGLLAGGTMLSVVGLISGLFATSAPMWLITRIELHNKLCWTGHGLFQTGFVWGQDIPEMGFTCEGQSSSTHEQYCHAQPDASFDRAMCQPITYAKVFMISAQVLGALTMVLITVLSRRTDKSTETAYRTEIVLAKLLLLCAWLTSALAGAGFFAVYTSQMFSSEHAHELSKHLVNPFTTAQFGCQFQSPLRASKAHLIQTLIKSSPLNCLYGGPSFAMAAASFVSWALAGWLFFILLRDVLRLERTLGESGGEFAGDGGLAFTSPMTDSAVVVPSIRHPLVTSLLYPRYYSMYGAISRKYQNHPQRKLILFVLPALAMGTATAFAIMMLMNGMAVDVFIRLSSPHFTHEGNFSHVLEKFPAHRFVPPEKDGPAYPTLEIIEEVFDFTMLTSIKNFWDGKAYALALLTAVFCAAWPYFRVVIQLYLFFVPVTENLRGRTLTWLDSLGKWTMVNTFILCFMGVSFHLVTVLRLKSLFSRDLLNVGVEVSLGPRIATYMFVFTVLVSIVISELFVFAHRLCKDWEETRNREEEAMRLDLDRTPSRKITYKHGYGYEAVCNRHQNLVPGKKHVYTTASNTMVWVCFLLTICTTLAGMLEVGMAFTFDGVVGQVLVDKSQVRREFSLMSVGTSIQTQMGSVPAGGMFLTGVFFLVAFVAPLLRISGLAVMWFVPMRPGQQRSWFHLMEVVESWSALDVFFVSTLAATLEIGEMSKVILGGSFPGVEELVNTVFPRFGGLFILHQELLPGMYLLFAGVVLEKAMSQFIVAQAATSVAERIEEEKLSIRRRLGLPGQREESDLFREVALYPETLQVLSPAARYVSASGALDLQYTGLPRIIWTTGIRLGLLRELVEENDEDEQIEYGELDEE